ncbi:hypothetical protein ALC60_12736 [Trachymyrmex zeteki]|uniref:Uncharacterized protein n=1 Tax=Mycetomoellerius zeteki TaxID=64791 RepID=A0A151WJZ4_9HYME|nr:hypothetical protein ALC60_12736 [Trachymyrmex zeteki]
MLNIYHIRLTDLQNVRKLESLHEILKFISVIMDLLRTLIYKIYICKFWNSRFK